MRAERHMFQEEGHSSSEEKHGLILITGHDGLICLNQDI